jgi:hypothetical protein
MSPEMRPRARPDVETHIFPDASALLFDPVENEGHVLKPLGALTWDYCDGALSCKEIAGEIAALVPAFSGLDEEVFRLLDEFSERGLLLV